MKSIFFLLLFVFSLSISSQNYDFGKISKEELEEKFNPADSSAAATYLYKHRKTYFVYTQTDGFKVITEVHQRIKIYNKEGFDYATQEIDLYKDGNDKMDFNALKANTYNLVDGKIEESKLEKDGVFKTEKTKYNDEVKFTLPNIKEGCIVEFKYRIDSPFYSYIEEFQFQHTIPIKKLEASFESPEYFNFKPNMRGYLALNPVIETKRGKITFNDKSRSGGLVTTTTFQSSSLEYEKTVSSFALENVPALKEEPRVNNINNYRSAVKYELSFTKFPQTPIKYYSTTWEDVVKTIYKNPDFGNELDKTGYFEKEIDELIGDTSSAEARVGLIYNFVKARVKWNDYFGIYVQDGVRQAYKNQTGNVAEINLMLTAMLRYAGLEANPVLVSTRSHGIPVFPTREGYNYVISSVELNDTTILLDATSKYSVPNILPFRVLNWEGRIIKKDGSSISVNLYPDEKSLNAVTLMANINADGKLEGSIRTIKKDHEAMVYRANYNESDKSQFLEKLENKYVGMEISEFSVDNDVDLLKPISETYKFSIESQADIIGDKMYFSPLFFLRTKENPFKLEKREYPVDFGYPLLSNYKLILNLPEGYKVESLPEPLSIMLPDNMGRFTFMITSNGSNVQIIINDDINTPIISPFHYETLKEYCRQLVEKENEQIVLTKV